jgi:hypothetical protein
MATSSIAELRHLRSAAIDDPERTVDLGKLVLIKGGFGSAGDECIKTNIRHLLIL